jgi:hypothetical protein
MGKRYFNVKVGSQKVHGGVIEIDISKPLEKRLRDFMDKDMTNSWEFRLNKAVKRGVCYQIMIPKQRFIAGAHAPALSIHNAPAGYAKTGESEANAFLTNDGELRIGKTDKGEEIYVSEITRNTAKRMKSEADNWFALQLYVCS